MKLTTPFFDIRAWVDHDKSGRAACPSCLQDGKTKQKNLSIDLSTGAYKCWRGCSPDQIRAALGVPKKQPPTETICFSEQKVQPSPSARSRTVSAKQVHQSHQRLLHRQGQPQQQALAWLANRGFTQEMIQHYRLGLDPRWITLDENNPAARECYWSVSIHISAAEPDQFYQKMRVAPWLGGTARPDYLANWSQYGVPATLFYTYRPVNAEATWFCEGEWDAMRLGWLAQENQASIAICCTTAGCGTVPKQEQLEQLPGQVTIFFDRNDEPRKDGSIPGDEGAKKLALTLGDRGRIAQVPMPDNCEVKGWDVSNALDAGFTWADFEAAAVAAIRLSPVNVDLQQVPSQGLGFAPQSRPHPALSGSQPVAAMSLRDSILQILKRYDTPSLREVELMDLARATGYSYRDVEKLAKSLAIEVDLQTDQVEAAKKLQDLIKTRRTQLDLNRYLEPWFAETLTETAKAMPTAPEFLFTTLLPVAASRVGTAAQVIVKPSAKYTQPMVFWSAIVANSGSMKTPAQRVILDPLINLERESYENYQLDLADYRVAIEASKAKKSETTEDDPPQLPSRKRFLTKDSTLETLQRIHAENPRGLLYYRDELAGAIKVRNQYRSGYGADEEAELDQWVGSAVIVDRAEKSICLPRSAISRTGAIQWEVLAKLMGDHNDTNGAWSRWLFCAANTPPRYLNLLQEDKDTGISEALTHLYIELEKVPQQDYLLSFEAKQLFETWQHHLVDAQRSEDTFGLQLVYPKIEAYTARLALWLHIVNATLRGEQPPQVITGDTMEKAIELAA
ncbi:MAG: DUF3987 domain-containing protein, partial [Cyanothece sp. SIO1E1]|nr:DUF3987 domain-containing protein [Cyanothece sp. SIO1E1]